MVTSVEQKPDRAYLDRSNLHLPLLRNASAAAVMLGQFRARYAGRGKAAHPIISDVVLGVEVQPMAARVELPSFPPQKVK